MGMHFFHPAQQMPLVEVVRRRATPAEVVATALAVGQGHRQDAGGGREPRGVRGQPAVRPLPQGGVLAAGGRGRARGRIDRAMVDFGFAMGPLQLIDMSGLDILEKTEADPAAGLSPARRPLADRRAIGRSEATSARRPAPACIATSRATTRRHPHQPTAQIIAASARGERGLANRRGLEYGAKIVSPADVADGGARRFACWKKGSSSGRGHRRGDGVGHRPARFPRRRVEVCLATWDWTACWPSFGELTERCGPRYCPAVLGSGSRPLSWERCREA